MRRPDAGFTLLEVMAAVAIVAIVFTTLARMANEGLQSQGISKRRLEASLLADELLSEVEAQMAEGMVPEINEEEFEEGIFGAVIEVTAFDVASVVPANAEAPENGSGPVLASPEAAAIPPLDVRRIDVTVTWTEAGNEFQVVRTTFGVDLAPVQEMLSAGGEGAVPAGLEGLLPAGLGDLVR
jgi:prepilin-type N-terminal cleavage/methylation domain-containing protein